MITINKQGKKNKNKDESKVGILLTHCYNRNINYYTIGDNINITSKDHASLTALSQATSWAVFSADFINNAVISSST